MVADDATSASAVPNTSTAEPSPARVANAPSPALTGACAMASAVEVTSACSMPTAGSCRSSARRMRRTASMPARSTEPAPVVPAATGAASRPSAGPSTLSPALPPDRLVDSRLAGPGLRSTCPTPRSSAGAVARCTEPDGPAEVDDATELVDATAADVSGGNDGSCTWGAAPEAVDGTERRAADSNATGTRSDSLAAARPAARLSALVSSGLTDRVRLDESIRTAGARIVTSAAPNESGSSSSSSVCVVGRDAPRDGAGSGRPRSPAVPSTRFSTTAPTADGATEVAMLPGPVDVPAKVRLRRRTVSGRPRSGSERRLDRVGERSGTFAEAVPGEGASSVKGGSDS